MKKIVICYFVIICTFSLQTLVYAGIYPFNIENIIRLNNLPNNEVLCLLQDKEGFMWIGTTGGLYQYDGYEIKEYRSNTKQPNLLTNNKINCLSEDSKGYILIGTNQGLNIFDKQTGQIRSSNNELINDLTISSILVLSSQHILLGTDSGLATYNILTDSCSFYSPHNSGDIMKPYSIKGMLKDSKGHVWIGTWDKGLYRYNPAINKFYAYPAFNKRKSAHVIFEDSDHNIWIGTWDEGLVLLHNPYDMTNVSWTVYRSDDSLSENDLASNYIYAFAEDTKSKTLWVGTRKGISLTSIKNICNNRKWTSYYPNKGNSILPLNEVDALLRDRNGDIWMGTLGGGLYFKKNHNQMFSKVRLSDSNDNLASNAIKSILIDSVGQVWTGVGNIDIIINDLTKQKIYSINKLDNSMQIKISAYALMQSRKNHKIWIGTDDLKVLIYDPYSTGKFKIKKLDTKIFFGDYSQRVIRLLEDNDKGYWMLSPKQLTYARSETDGDIVLKGSNLTTVTQENSGNLWVGSSNGLVKLDIDKNKKLLQSKIYNSKNNNLPIDNVLYIYQDRNDKIWLGTDGAGLCYYNKKKDRFVSVSESMVFPTDIVSSICEDEKGSLWLGTNVGLIKYTPSSSIEQSTYRIYTKAEGLPDNIFLKSSVAKSKDGMLFFGTNQGYVYFSPDKIRDIESRTKVIVTDIKLDNMSILELNSTDRAQSSSISPVFTEDLKIQPKFNNFSISFSSLNYNTPQRVKYAYKLDGYDLDWKYTDNDHRFAYYSNLPFGNYTFFLKSTNEYGVWEEYERTINIEILPPLWRTWWAYLIYILLLIGIFIIAYKSIKKKIKLKNQILLEKSENQRIELLNQEKMKFFTNVTHELFTPLTIIAAATEDLQPSISSEQHNIIISNVNRLIRLIQQILEFRKAETGNLKLRVASGDLKQFIQKNVENFNPLMHQKNIELITHYDSKDIQAYFDSDKLDKILYNLLSNALKYNQAGGKVEVTLIYEEENEFAKIIIKDYGKGLSKGTMDNLFKRFYEGDFRKFNTIGTGIGLSLVKDLVVLHKGNISVENSVGEGVAFIVRLPMKSNMYDNDEIDRNNLIDESTVNNIHNTDKSDTIGEEIEYSILLVEDNSDLLILMEKLLCKRFNVFTASNGKEALDIINAHETHLIISDILMPEMDGYELCTTLKKDIEFNHIPIILLTANNKEEVIVNAYNAGADGYISKPFSLSVLQARIINLLNAKKKNADTFQKQVVLDPRTLDFTSYDEEFLAKLMDVVHQNMDNPDFDQEQLIELVGITRSSLYRKLKLLAGMTPSALIKSIRLKAAYKLLLEKGTARVSEIAYAVGFNDAKYFSICFKKEFGHLPTEFPDK